MKKPATSWRVEVATIFFLSSYGGTLAAAATIVVVIWLFGAVVIK